MKYIVEDWTGRYLPKKEEVIMDEEEFLKVASAYFKYDVCEVVGVTDGKIEIWIHEKEDW